MHQFYILKDFFVKHKWSYFFGVIFLVFTDLLQLIRPRILGNFADDFQQKTLTRTGVMNYALLIILISLALAFFRFLWRLYVQGAARKLEFHLRQRLFGHLLTLAPAYYDQQKTGDLMAHATNDINAVRTCFGIGVVMLTDAIFLTLSALTLMFLTIDVRLSLLAVLPLPLTALVATRFSSLIHNRFKKVQEAFSKLTGQVQESFSGIRVLQSFAQEQSRFEDFTRFNQANINANLNLVRVSGFLFPLIQFLSALSFLVVLSYGGMLVIKSRISLGDFVAFNGYLATLIWPMMALGWLINIIQRGSASMSRLNKIFETEPEITDQCSTTGPKELDGRVKVQNLCFNYPNTAQRVLTGINFSLNPGQTLAVVGRTGSGKSTLIDLLLRVYEPPRETIFYDEVEIHHLPLNVLRQSIGYVPQDTFLFSASIKDNIALSDLEADPAKLEEVTKAAGIYEEITGFLDDFETVIGERGVTLSGGQKQRLAIARALYKDPKILIMDDSLSAVDTATEAAILKNLKSIRQNRTTIIVSHRISTVQDADWAIVLEGGQIIEEGTHQDLLELKGLYYGLNQKQLLEAELNGKR